MRSKRIVFNILIGLFTLLFVLLAVFVFDKSYLRFFETLKDLWDSVKIYVSVIFQSKTPPVGSIESFSKVFTVNVLPEDISGFKARFITWGCLLFHSGNFGLWLDGVFLGIYELSMLIAIIAPVFILFIFVFRKIYGIGNNRHNVDTLPLKIFKRFEYRIYTPIKRFITDFIDYVKSSELVKKCWLTLWVFNLNFASIIVAAIAFYLYFSVTFNFLGLYKQVGKLFVDLGVVLETVPLIVWIIIGWVVFCWWRKRRAKRKLRHFEARNCGFINELPIVSITCGSMGKKKTTMVTDMVLSQEVMFRQRALEILQKADMKFPNFPWICLEDELRRCMEYHTVYNLATIKKWIALKRRRYEKHGNADLQLYGYDGEHYGTSFNDALRINGLWDILETYALAYFVYVIESSLIVSNYSIRTDNVFLDEGNFPLWITDFFPEHIREGRHSHVLDFDVLRLGKKMIEDNPYLGSFEFGVVAITEIGKERGNNLELKELKKGADETNQKNDLFNAWLKMCRHSATIDNFPFIKVFTDEQRPESWGADARDLCDVIHIVSSGEQRLALPFYTIEDMLAEWAFNRFMGLYTDFRFRRGDNTLLVYLLKGITAWIWKRNMRIYNRYGYSITKIEKERGTMDGKTENKKYYLMNWKIYARRFTTDCFSDYFNDLAGKSGVGLNDYREYATEKATVYELKAQNSYFINSLY